VGDDACDRHPNSLQSKPMNTYTGAYQKQGKWYMAWIEEIPGVNTQGETLKEAKENLAEALELVLEVNKEMSRKLMPRRKTIRSRVQIPA